MARTFQPSPWSITGGPLSQAGSAITGNNLTRAMGALRSKNSGYDSIYSDQIGNEASLYRAESAGNVAVNQAEWNAWANDRISRRQSNSINKEANKNKIGGALKLGTSLAIGAISLFSDVKTKNTIEDLNNALIELVLGKIKEKNFFDLSAAYLVNIHSSSEQDCENFISNFMKAGCNLLRFTFPQQPKGIETEKGVIPSEIEKDKYKNTLENLEMLLTTGEVVGDTKQALSQYGQLNEGKLSYKIPYPVAMDSLVKAGEPTKEKMTAFIKNQLPDFDTQPEDYKEQIFSRVKEYFKTKEYSAETFEMYQLNGTPSTILVDRKGILRDVSFGQTANLESMIEKLLNE